MGALYGGNAMSKPATMNHACKVCNASVYSTCTLYLYILGALSDALDESKFFKKLMDIPCKNYDSLQKHKFYNYCTIGYLIVYSFFLFL